MAPCRACPEPAPASKQRRSSCRRTAGRPEAGPPRDLAHTYSGVRTTRTLAFSRIRSHPDAGSIGMLAVPRRTRSVPAWRVTNQDLDALASVRVCVCPPVHLREQKTAAILTLPASHTYVASSSMSGGCCCCAAGGETAGGLGCRRTWTSAA
eukprot:scaffold11428_cov105-Isochrysis_galbana.AAC.6